jgi:type II secretory pathway pseudopilin PulG
MSDPRDEQGIILVTAIVLLTVIMGFGFGLLLFTENQQTASATEQATESALNIAEAALNAQVGQLSRAWPVNAGEAYPERCTGATSTATNGCPDPSSLSAGYPNISPVACPAGSPTEKWGSPLTNQWTTYVRDDTGEPPSPYFNSPTERTAPTWDSNGDEKMWVRAVGVAQCHVVVLVTLVSRQLVAINFPRNVATGNWFKVTNNGKKVIVNTAGEPPVSQPGPIGMRCEGLGGVVCEQWEEKKEQISPNTTKAPAAPSPLLSEAQLATLKTQAQAAGAFRSGAQGNCPTSLGQTSGLPAYIEGCGALRMSGGVGNSPASPGFLVLADGTLELKGNATFYGVIYARNPSNSPGAVVALGGTAQVVGAIDVDGNGGIELGSSKANLIYEPRAITELKTYAGATPTRNGFRILPSGQ